MKLLMISGDRSLAEGKRGAFYYMLEEFGRYWERIDIICPQDTRYKIPFDLAQGGQETNKSQISNSKPQEVFDNVCIHQADCGILGQPWFILKMGRKLHEEHHYDLMTVHEYPPFYNGVGARWLYNKIKIPYMVEYHHFVGYPRAADFKERFYRFLYKFFVPYVCNKAKLIRVVNEKQSREFLTKLGVDNDKIKNIGSQYIDLEVFRPMDLEKKYDVVFAGRLVKNKNLEMLIEALAIVRCKMSDVRCVIIGDGPERKNIQLSIINYQLLKNIELIGWLPTAQDVAEFYNRSRLFVMPSLNEGGPRVCLEAMACGVPVVATKVGVMLDIIEDGVNGFFCDWTAESLADKIMKILDCENMKITSEKARETVLRFERKSMIKNLAETYCDVVNKVNLPSLKLRETGIS